MAIRVSIDAQDAKRPDIREHTAELVGQCAKAAFLRLCDKHFPASGTAIVIEFDLEGTVEVEGATG